MGDYLDWKRAYWRGFLVDTGHARVLDPAWQLDGRVLDAGCGPAGVFTVLAKASVTGVDPLLDDYDALPHFDRTAYPNVHWVSRPLEAYAPERPYEYVFCLNVINHVRDLSRVLRTLTRALTPGGTLVLSVDAHRFAPLRWVFALVPGDVLHPHQLTVAQYESVCTEAGLRLTAKRRYRRGAIFDYWVLTLRRAHD